MGCHVPDVARIEDFSVRDKIKQRSVIVIHA